MAVRQRSFQRQALPQFKYLASNEGKNIHLRLQPFRVINEVNRQALHYSSMEMQQQSLKIRMTPLKNRMKQNSRNSRPTETTMAITAIMAITAMATTGTEIMETVVTMATTGMATVIL